MIKIYASTSDVYRLAGISSTEISEADVIAHLKESSLNVDRIAFTTFWAVNTSGTATSGGDNTLTDSAASFGTNSELVDYYVWIYGGTGIDQIRKITSHTDTELTVEEDWDTNPDSTSTYRIIWCGQDPRLDVSFDGDDTTTWFMDKYPIRILKSVTIDSTSVSVSNISKDSETGELYLGSSAEVRRWTSKRAFLNNVKYYFGVYPIPHEAKQLCAVYAAIATLVEQTGGTFNVPSTYQLPEGSVTIGQAYINIRETINGLEAKRKYLERGIRKYPSIV